MLWLTIAQTLALDIAGHLRVLTEVGEHLNHGLGTVRADGTAVIVSLADNGTNASQDSDDLLAQWKTEDKGTESNTANGTTKGTLVDQAANDTNLTAANVTPEALPGEFNGTMDDLNCVGCTFNEKLHELNPEYWPQARLRVVLVNSRKQAVTAGQDGAIRLWSTQNCDTFPLATLKLDRNEKIKPVSAVALSPDENSLWAGYGDGTIRVWSLTAAVSREFSARRKRRMDKVAPAMKHRDSGFAPMDEGNSTDDDWLGAPVLTLAFSRPGGSIVYSGGKDGTVCAWSASNYTRLHCTSTLNMPVNSLAVTAWGGVFAGGAGYSISYFGPPVGQMVIREPPSTRDPLTFVGQWATQHDTVCGQGGTCENTAPMAIGPNSEPWQAATRANVDACKETCLANINCGGFNYVDQHGKCYFREMTRCYNHPDTDRDCYTLDRKRAVEGTQELAFDGQWAKEEGQVCGSGGDSCGEDKLSIGPNKEPWQAVSNRSAVDACKQTCIDNEECNGFNYADDLKQCFFRAKPACFKDADAKRDCYTLDRKRGGLQVEQPTIPLAFDAGWAKQEGYVCGAGGDSCSATTLDIGPGGEPWVAATREDVGECKKLCAKSEKCKGFNFAEQLGKCFFRGDPSCFKEVDADRDCYTLDRAKMTVDVAPLKIGGDSPTVSTDLVNQAMGEIEETPAGTKYPVTVATMRTQKGEGFAGGFPERCMDDDKNSVCNTHPHGEANPWLQLDFGETRAISAFKVYNLLTDCKHRLECGNIKCESCAGSCTGDAVGKTCGAMIRVGDTPLAEGSADPYAAGSQECKTFYSHKETFIVNCSSTVTGRYAQFILPGGDMSRILELRELQAYGPGPAAGDEIVPAFVQTEPVNETGSGEAKAKAKAKVNPAPNGDKAEFTPAEDATFETAADFQWRNKKVNGTKKNVSHFDVTPPNLTQYTPDPIPVEQAEDIDMEEVDLPDVTNPPPLAVVTPIPRDPPPSALTQVRRSAASSFLQELTEELSGWTGLFGGAQSLVDLSGSPRAEDPMEALSGGGPETGCNDAVIELNSAQDHLKDCHGEDANGTAACAAAQERLDAAIAAAELCANPTTAPAAQRVNESVNGTLGHSGTLRMPDDNSSEFVVDGPTAHPHVNDDGSYKTPPPPHLVDANANVSTTPSPCDSAMVTLREAQEAAASCNSEGGGDACNTTAVKLTETKAFVDACGFVASTTTTTTTTTTESVPTYLGNQTLGCVVWYRHKIVNSEGPIPNGTVGHGWPTKNVSNVAACADLCMNTWNLDNVSDSACGAFEYWDLDPTDHDLPAHGPLSPPNTKMGKCYLHLTGDPEGPIQPDDEKGRSAAKCGVDVLHETTSTTTTTTTTTSDDSSSDDTIAVVSSSDEVEKPAAEVATTADTGTEPAEGTLIQVLNKTGDEAAADTASALDALDGLSFTPHADEVAANASKNANSTANITEAVDDGKYKGPIKWAQAQKEGLTPRGLPSDAGYLLPVQDQSLSTEHVNQIVLTGKGDDRLLAACSDGQVRIYDTQSLQSAGSLNFGSGSSTSRAALSVAVGQSKHPDGTVDETATKIYASGSGGIVRVWDVVFGQIRPGQSPMGDMGAPKGTWIGNIVLDDDSDRLFAASERGDVSVWSTNGSMACEGIAVDERMVWQRKWNFAAAGKSLDDAQFKSYCNVLPALKPVCESTTITPATGEDHDRLNTPKKPVLEAAPKLNGTSHKLGDPNYAPPGADEVADASLAHPGFNPDEPNETSTTDAADNSTSTTEEGVNTTAMSVKETPEEAWAAATGADHGPAAAERLKKRLSAVAAPTTSPAISSDELAKIKLEQIRLEGLQQIRQAATQDAWSASLADTTSGDATSLRKSELRRGEK